MGTDGFRYFDLASMNADRTSTCCVRTVNLPSVARWLQSTGLAAAGLSTIYGDLDTASDVVVLRGEGDAHISAVHGLRFTLPQCAVDSGFSLY